MTSNEIAYTVVGFLSGFLGAQLGQLLTRRLEAAVQKKIQPRDTVVGGNWVQLPSGWMRDDRDLAGYVANLDGGPVYWWVSRAGRTIVEGPSESLEEGRVEVEAALREFRR